MPDAQLITTVIPTYRRPALLRRAILSALGQTERRVQVCVYDNASGDQTAAVVAEIAARDPRVRYHCHPANIGMSANVASGLSQVTTPYFSLLSDDDQLLPECYATALRGFALHRDALLSATGTICQTEAGLVSHVTLADWPRLGYYAPPAGLYAWTIERAPYITSVLFRHAVIDAVGLPDATVFHADFAYLWRIIARYPYVVDRTPGALVTMHAQQATRHAGAAVWRQTYAAMRADLATVRTLPQGEPEHAAQVLRSTISRAVLVDGLAALRDGETALARDLAGMLRTDLAASATGTLLRVAALALQSAPAQRVLTTAYARLLHWRTSRRQATARR